MTTMGIRMRLVTGSLESSGLPGVAKFEQCASSSAQWFRHTRCIGPEITPHNLVHMEIL